MRTRFRGWPIMVNDTHTRRRTAVDNQVTLLALLDLSAAFKCVDHDILLSRLQSSFGLGGITLTWIQSCLVSKLTVSKLTCQRVGLSASCLVSELTVSELVCQREVCEASCTSNILFLSARSPILSYSLFTAWTYFCSIRVIFSK